MLKFEGRKLMKLINKLYKKIIVAVLCICISFTSTLTEAAPFPYWAILGTVVHKAVQAEFMLVHPNNGKVEVKIPGLNVSSFYRVDCMYDVSHKTDIYEIKPMSYASGYYNTIANAQINNYVSSARKAYNKPSYRGTAWDPTGLVLPTGPDYFVLLFTNYAVDEGLVFYKRIKRTQQEEYSTEADIVIDPGRAGQLAVEVDGRTYSGRYIGQDSNTGLALGIIFIAGGVVLVVGTIAQDVLTAGVGLADDAATIGAASELIRKGTEFLTNNPLPAY